MIRRGEEPVLKNGDVPIAGYERLLSNSKAEMMKEMIGCECIVNTIFQWGSHQNIFYLYIYVNKYNFNWMHEWL